MAANFETGFMVRKPAWHGLGEILPECPTSEDAIVAAGLDWNVIKKPIFTADGEIENYFANVRDKDNTVLGVVSGRYEIVQNLEAFSFTDSLVDDGMVYETAGSLNHGKVIWLLGKLPRTTILGDDLEPYVCFTNSFDGSGAIRVCCTPTRVVCQNTLNLALSTAKRSWSTRHIGNIEDKLQQARVTLGLIDDYVGNLKAECERLADEKMSDAEVEDMLDMMYPVDPEQDSAIRQKRVDNLKENFFTCLQAPDIKQFKNTKYAVIMAATDYADHGEPMRKTKNFQSSRWFNVIQGHSFVDTVYKNIAA